IASPPAWTSWPSTVTRPASMVMSPVRMRMRVVLPAPSGPTSPVMRPDLMVAEMSARAGGPSPKRLVTPSMRTRTSFTVRILRRVEPHRHRHALPQALVGVLHDDAQAVDEIASEVRRLHRLEREFGDGGDEAALPLVGRSEERRGG